MLNINPSRQFVLRFELFFRQMGQSLRLEGAQRVHHVPEDAVRLLQQNVRLVELNRAARIHHEHSVRIDDCVQPMRHRQNCTFGEFYSNRLLNERISSENINKTLDKKADLRPVSKNSLLLWVNVRRRLVENENSIFPQNCSRQAEQLSLSDAEIASVGLNGGL